MNRFLLKKIISMKRQETPEEVSSLSPRVSPSRAPVLSWAHYFQAPATQATH